MAYDDGSERDLIGLSLSFCVQDILTGKISEDRVKVIVSGASGVKTKKGFAKILAQYGKFYWNQGDTRKEEKFNVKTAKIIAWRLRDEGRIVFAKINIAHGHWAKQMHTEDLGRETKLCVKDIEVGTELIREALIKRDIDRNFNLLAAGHTLINKMNRMKEEIE